MAGRLQAERGRATLETRQLARNGGRDGVDVRASEGSRIAVTVVVAGVGGAEHVAAAAATGAHGTIAVITR